LGHPVYYLRLTDVYAFDCNFILIL